MELRQLRYFLVLADQGQFGRAAHRLHVTQQALSMAMTALERATGCELLLRGRGRRVVELTAAGAALREHAVEIVGQADRALQRVRSIEDSPAAPGTGNRLVVGLLTGGAAELNVPILERFRSGHPELAIEVRSLGHAGRAAPCEAVDVVVGPVVPPRDGARRPAPGPGCTTLFTDRTVVALPLGHRLTRRAGVEVSELRGEPQLAVAGMPTPGLRPVPETADDIPRRRTAPAHIDAGLTAVGAGLGVTVLAACTARYHARPDVTYRPLIGAPGVEFCVRTRGPVAADPDGPTAAFVRTAVETAAELRHLLDRNGAAEQVPAARAG